MVKRCKLKWYGQVSCSSGLAETILQGTVKGGRRHSRQKKSWEDNIREWTGLEFYKFQRVVENRKMEETGCEVVCGAPTTPAARGLVKGATARYYASHTKTMLSTRKSMPRSSKQSDHMKT